MEDNIVLDVKDCSGRRVILRTETWTHHIQRRHPELTRCLRRVENALREPTCVHQDGGFSTIHLYLRLGAIDRFRHQYLVVVVRCDLEPAQVITTYITGAPRGSAGRPTDAEAGR